MNITLKEAVKAFCKGRNDLGLFAYYVKRSLTNTRNNNTILKEGEVVEIQDGFVTISFTWDMISAVNNLTNKYVDLTTPEKAFEVFD